MASFKSPEQRIRIKIGLIFLVVILYFIGLIAYSSTLKKSIDDQKEIIDNAYRVLAYSDRLIHSVQHAQEVLNIYLVNPRVGVREQYDSISEDITQQILTIQSLSPEKEQNILLKDIDSLLQEKNRIVNRLLGQFRSQNPIVKLDQKLETYDDIVQDSLTITTNEDTTIVQAPQQKSFWGRLKNVFNPEHQPDTVITITRTEQEARSSTRVDTVRYTDLKNITREASESYSIQIARIAQQVRELVVAEQYISLHISQLISQFYTEAIETTRLATDNSESLTRRTIGFAITVGMLSVLLILIIIFLITDDLNKGQKARVELADEKQLTEELIKSRHKLLLSVSHDIKTPLSSIMGYMEIWDSEDEQVQRKRQLRSAQNSGKHILSMLNNLLEFSRLEQNSGKPQVSRFNLVELMEDIVRMFRPLTDEKGLVLGFQNKTYDKFTIETDETLLKQILVNVISNAVKFTLHGQVMIGLEYINEQLVFTITDTGVGIEKEDLPAIFKPFSRISNPLKAEGSGFGLYVTKGLVDTLKGTIRIKSEKGVGTRITIRLPIPRVMDFVISKGDAISKGGNPLHYQILLFEDDPSLGNMIKEFLTHRGYKAVLCGNPNEIDHFLQTISSFDIVFTDMQMAGISGHDILREIRMTGSDVPVWLMTAYDDYTSEKALADGFSGFIVKPLSMSGLESILTGEDTKARSNEKPAGDVNTGLRKNQNGLSMRFPRLSAMLNHDETAIQEIIEGFIESSQKDMDLLRIHIEKGAFVEAQRLCHRIHPFLEQLDAAHLCKILLKMEQTKGEDESAYPEWRRELSEAIEQIDQFREAIQKEYLTNKE